MSGMNGLDLVKRIRSNSERNDIKIIMMSSVAELEELSHGNELGVNYYIQKPIRNSDLFHAILKSYNIINNENNDKDGVNFPDDEIQTLNILLVEDNIINQKVAQSLLKRWNHKVSIASDGQEAIDLLKRNKFDLVFMDIQMPNLDGIEATQIIRNSTNEDIDPSITIIAMTAHAMRGDRESFLEAGMDDYISKPINVDELLKVIKRNVTPHVTMNMETTI
jgi:CheY-like chemotaxis protein